MRASRVLSRVRLTVLACLAVAVFAGVMVASAGAQGEGGGQAALSPVFNPQETNVPYLAWRGEEVRLVKCTHDNLSSIAGAPTSQTVGGFYWLDTSMTIFNYSGPQENSFDGPKAVTNGASIFYDDNTGRWCVRADFISNKPGIVTVKFTLSINGVILAQHDFLIGWMAVNSAAITNPGTVTDNPGDEPGNSANVQVTGSIPLNAEFQADWGLPATLVMPNDWALWASKMATTDDYLAYQQAASTYWDIHDSSGPGGDGGSPDIHVSQTSCPGSTPSTTIDQVDNCNGPGGGSGRSQSRVFGDFGTAFGPFDPSYSDTLLSDGNLNSFDAPMPPLKVMFNTAGGMGFFDDSCLNDKSSVYNRNFDPTNPTPNNYLTDCIAKTHTKNEAHALYAPYYNAYIPATSRDPFGAASGTDGPIYTNYTGQPNNFPGYQWYGGYHYWQIARENVVAQGGDSPCLLTTGPRGEPIYRQKNAGDTNITVFTDEHGEARAQWQPGMGNDNFGTSVGFVDDNGGCDLQGVALGDQTITASVQYPFQPIGTAIPASGSIVKHINNFFHKDVSCVKKNVAGTAIAYICTATAIDINNDGTVFNGEQVCFSREPENIWYSVGGSTPHDNGYCVPLAGGGPGVPAHVSVETPATRLGENIDVQAYFAGEKLLRDTCIIVGQSPSTPGPCGGTSSSTSTTGPGGTTTGTPGTTTGGITTIHTGGSSGHSTKATVGAVQLVLNKNGTRVLRVNVHSTKPSAKISIRLINAKGKVVTVAIRTVKTNKLVTVRNLRISKQVKRVRVSVVQ